MNRPDMPPPIPEDMWSVVGGAPITRIGIPSSNGYAHAEDVPTDQDTYRTEGLLKVWEQEEPAPRQFAVAGLIPDGAVTLFYGDGGQGKSYVVLAMAMLSCMGRPFLGRFVEKRVALYMDAELDATEFTRRAYKLARGMGHDKPPDGLHYYQVLGSMSDRVVQGRVHAAFEECGAEFVVFDSLSIGSYGVDASDASDMIGVMKFLESLRCPVIAIDHISKPQAGVNLSSYRAFGSVFKGNVARSSIQVIRADGGALTLLHKKSNFAALSDPLHLILEFDEEDHSVRVSEISPGDERLAGMEDHLPATEQVLIELAKYDDGARPEFLATELGKSLKTIKNYLSALNKSKRAYPVGDGTWRVVS